MIRCIQLETNDTVALINNYSDENDNYQRLINYLSKIDFKQLFDSEEVFIELLPLQLDTID
ncbi:MAG: hypothetical protein ACLTAI_07715 [Thomasclavelia sp.]